MSALTDALDDSGYPYYRQGSLTAAEDYPEGLFFTYWELYAPYRAHYDNRAHSAAHEWQVYAYAPDPAQLNAGTAALMQLLLSRGFVLAGAPVDLTSDRPDYIGRSFTTFYLEALEDGHN